MSKVYVLSIGYDYEGSKVVGVFDSELAAEDYAVEGLGWIRPTDLTPHWTKGKGVYHDSFYIDDFKVFMTGSAKVKADKKGRQGEKT